MMQDPSHDYQIVTVLLTPTVLFECCPYLLSGISVLQAAKQIIWEPSLLIRTPAHRDKEFTDVISISCDYLCFLEILAQAKWFFNFFFFLCSGICHCMTAISEGGRLHCAGPLLDRVACRTKFSLWRVIHWGERKSANSLKWILIVISFS